MDAMAFVLLFLGFFQFSAAAHLANEPVLASHRVGRLLAVLFGINAVLTIAPIAAPESGSLVGALLLGLDTLTAPLLLAVILEVKLRRPARWQIVVGTLATGEILAWWFVPGLNARPWDSYFRAIPYYLSLGALVIFLGGEPDAWKRWISLAFLPRAAQFGTVALFTPSSVTMDVRVEALAEAALLIAVGVATWRLMIRPEPPRRVVIPTLVLGPVVGLLMTRPLPSPAFDLLNLLTLALARPLFIISGILPRTLRRTLVISAMTAVVAFVALALAAGPMGIEVPQALALAVGVGLMVFAASEAIVLHRLARRPGPSNWKRILIALRGSSSTPREGKVRLEWSQLDLSRQLGIDVRRVSEFPKFVNSRSDKLLDAYVPGWRAERLGPTPPILVLTRKGAVEGVSSARVYYRLTEWGERLATATIDDGTRLADDSHFDDPNGQTPAGLLR